MNNEALIKRSPIVLMWKFAVIEAAGFLLYLGAVMLGNSKYELYTQLSFSNTVPFWQKQADHLSP